MSADTGPVDVAGKFEFDESAQCPVCVIWRDIGVNKAFGGGRVH